MPENKIPPHWDHQKETLKLLKKQPRVFDTSDPGTGKTRSSIEAFAERRKKRGKCALIIAPKSLLQTAWGDDIDTFAGGLDYSVCLASNRAAAFEEGHDVYITNTDAVTWLAANRSKFFKRFDTIIVDESSAFKHRTSQRSKALNKIRHHFEYRQSLTGTPNPKSVTDLFNQLFFLDDGDRLGTEFFKFRAATCIPKQIGPQPNMVEWRDKPGAEDAVAKLISDITIRHEFEDCMDIPPNTVHRIKYVMPKKQQRAYQKLEHTAVLTMEEGTVTAVNAAVLANKLLQIASGAVYADGVPTVIDNGRYGLITDLISERKHSVVFFIWRHQKEQLVEHLTKRRITHAVIDGTVPIKKRVEIVKAYQAGFYQTILLHPKTGAHGLTLTRGTSTIWCSPIYEPDFLKQGIHRIYRGGQTERTETIMIEATGTLEGHVFSMLGDKNARMTNLLNLLKEQRQ